MHLYLKSGESERWLTIQLVDGHIPRIAGLSSVDTLAVTDNLEPAIWCKVMVLQSITVDCDKRIACWRSGILDKDGEPITHWLSGEDSFYDWDDDVDELFNLANDLITENPLAERDEKEQKVKIVDFERNLFKMLHCYILPKVQLYPADLDRMNTALKAQNKCITQLEDITLMHTRLAEHYLSHMRSLRQTDIFPTLETLVETGAVSEELVEVLMYDIKKAEPALRDEVNHAQLKVEKLKEVLSRGAVCRKLNSDLAEARRNRDSVHRNLERLLIGKALVMILIDVAQQVNNTKVELSESCLQYIRLYKRVKEEKKIAEDILDKKLRALGVRECIHSVIKDLEKDNPSYGEDPEIKETKPEWQTLNQRISFIVHNKEHPVGLNFNNFCQNLELSYRKILRSTENIVYGSSRFMTSYNEFYIISEQDLGLNKLFLEDQRNIILAHLHQISQLLSEHFSKRTQMFMRKVQLCYEKCFFNRVGRDLILIYRVVHGKVMQTIEERVNALKEFSVDKLGLQMKDEWWLQLFEPNDTTSFEYTDSDVSSSLSKYYGYGDDESVSDIEEEDFCSDEESGSSRIPNFSSRKRTNTDHKKITENLLKSKEKILSRSLPNINGCGLDLIKTSTVLLQEQFDKTAAKSSLRIDTNALGRYLEAEIEIDLNKNLRNSLRRTQSVSTALAHETFPASSLERRNSSNSLRQSADTFDKHFGTAMSAIKAIFTNSSPLKKMQCLTNALRTVSHKIEELRLRCYENEEVDRAKIVVTAEDLLPLLVLLLLKMAPHDVAKLYAELLFISDLMADFLSSGCHSYALCEFQIAFRVLDQTCEELQV